MEPQKGADSGQDKRLADMFTVDPAPTYEQYDHHGQLVWVNSADKGTHRTHCLCFSCDNFHPGTEGNCPIAQAIFENCVKFNIVTPVYECPEFTEK